MLELKGCGTALVTPFRDGAVDYDSYAKLIDRQVGGGVDFLVPLATTGETPALAVEEKLELLRLTKARSGSLPLLVGCGSNSLEATLSNMRMLEKDADAFLVVVPFYNKPTQEGQYKYFRAVAEASPKPVVIYNVPGRTGANMNAETCVRLACDCPNIIATKEASGNYAQVSEILRTAPREFTVLSGDDDMTFAFMCTGARGVISVASNAVPELVSGLAHAVLEGRFEEGRRLHHLLSPLFKACFLESNPIPIKALMGEMGLMSSEVRLPLSEAAPSTRKKITDIYKALQ